MTDLDPNPTQVGLKSRSAAVSCDIDVCYPFGRRRRAAPASIQDLPAFHEVIE
jgi:hypothetical protein